MTTRPRSSIDKRKIVIFGAGKIGRSFLGQLFGRSGYEVVFIDINERLIDQLNSRGRYKVIIRSDSCEETLDITRVRGIHPGDHSTVMRDLASATLAALSVGSSGLPGTFPLIAGGLVMRRRLFGDVPLDILIAENLRNAGQYVHEGLKKSLPGDYPLDALAGLVETSIGKMVPIMKDKDLEEDPLQVFAEPYNTLIVAKKGFRNPVPEVPGLEAKENIKAWVDRKLFIHNLGHAAAAYLGYKKFPDAVYIHEVLDDPGVYGATRDAMLQSAEILRALYPDEFTAEQLQGHIDDLLFRFRNKALGDTLFRVGCDLMRKLGPEDRLGAPIHAAMALKKPCHLIYDVLLAALDFRATDEQGRHFPGDERLFAEGKNFSSFIMEQMGL